MRVIAEQFHYTPRDSDHIINSFGSPKLRFTKSRIHTFRFMNNAG